jgi:hypothetical protein
MPASPRGRLMLDDRNACCIQTISSIFWSSTHLASKPYRVMVVRNSDSPRERPTMTALGRPPRRCCLSPPLQGLEPCRAFPLTPGRVWSTDTASKTCRCEACVGALTHPCLDRLHGHAGGHTHALPTLRG